MELIEGRAVHVQDDAGAGPLSGQHVQSAAIERKPATSVKVHDQGPAPAQGDVKPLELAKVSSDPCRRRFSSRERVGHDGGAG